METLQDLLDEAEEQEIFVGKACEPEPTQADLDEVEADISAASLDDDEDDIAGMLDGLIAESSRARRKARGGRAAQESRKSTVPSSPWRTVESVRVFQKSVCRCGKSFSSFSHYARKEVHRTEPDLVRYQRESYIHEPQRDVFIQVTVKQCGECTMPLSTFTQLTIQEILDGPSKEHNTINRKDNLPSN